MGASFGNQGSAAPSRKVDGTQEARSGAGRDRGTGRRGGGARAKKRGREGWSGGGKAASQMRDEGGPQGAQY